MRVLVGQGQAVMEKKHRIAVVALDGVTALDIAIPIDVFTIDRDVPYELKVCGTSDRVSTASGLALAVGHGLDAVVEADTVIIPGYQPVDRPVPAPVLDALVASVARGARVASICTGAFALAAAGVLDGQRATTHWQHLGELQALFPSVQIDRDVLYVDNGNVLTSAGMCCGIDMCLYMVMRDLGAATANRVARALVAPPHRDGGQAQYVPAAVAIVGDTSLAATRAWVLNRLAETITVTEMAQHARMSVRTFMRRFTDETGTTPLQWLVNARITAARELLETTDYSVDRVAQDSGLGSAANLRLHFRRSLATTPTAYRQAFSCDYATATAV
ncbi:helix-turn-helix domain-containing protein [Mycolicibacterium septicum]|uniref:GlxA family transcriptional regulator n=1 Tax=Mycolicibacterium septicum TaxID=98668 RepID=UPI0023E2BB8B|nr:helix-turn-helix domain-containing protein [Mycolicibacterium septicum]MDF3336888.1 helix-turn-helix domain-containing protein [Mycolicibacterium septicum]